MQSGLHASLNVLSAQWRSQRVFEPQISTDEAAQRMQRWARAVRQTLSP
jgi:glycerol kinase